MGAIVSVKQDELFRLWADADLLLITPPFNVDGIWACSLSPFPIHPAAAA